MQIKQTKDRIEVNSKLLANIKYAIKHKYTSRLLLGAVLLAGFVEYQIFQDFSQFSSHYKNNFSQVATAAANKVAGDDNYCILKPDYRDKHDWLILNNFAELDIERVITQAVYFRLGWPNRVKTGVGQRVPHFELYTQSTHYLWSFSQQAFYQYRKQNTVRDKYLSLICQDLAGKMIDRQQASVAYQQDPYWQQQWITLVTKGNH